MQGLGVVVAAGMAFSMQQRLPKRSARRRCTACKWSSTLCVSGWESERWGFSAGVRSRGGRSCWEGGATQAAAVAWSTGSAQQWPIQRSSGWRGALCRRSSTSCVSGWESERQGLGVAGRTWSCWEGGATQAAAAAFNMEQQLSERSSGRLQHGAATSCSSAHLITRHAAVP